MRHANLAKVAVVILLLGSTVQAGHDVTSREDIIVGVPNDGDWPSQESPALALDDHANTKYLHFKGDRFPDAGPTGFRVTPAAGSTVVNAMTFTTANDCPARDPIEFELHGSNQGIDGPYKLIVRGEIFDFKQDWPWPRNTKTTTPIVFSNNTAYRHYQVLFPAIRDPTDACANSMQIAEVELLAMTYQATAPQPAEGTVVMTPVFLRWTAGETAALHNVYLGKTPELTEADQIASLQPAFPAVCQTPADLEPGAIYYWRVDQIDGEGKVYVGDVWHFVATPNTAYAPTPRDGDKWMSTDTVLAWLPGRTATTHEVFFGTHQQAVSARDTTTFQGRQEAPVYAPGPLEPGRTYHWAVDELDESSRYAGSVWSFTTFSGGGVKAEYFSNMTLSGPPAVTQIEDQIDHYWGEGTIAGLLNDGVSARWTADLEIAIADTYTFITTSDDGVRLWLDGELLIDNWTEHGPMDNYSRPVELAPGIYELRVEWYDFWAGATLQLWWETPALGRQIIPAGPLQPPLWAKPLYPADGDANVPQNVMLRWSAGDWAVAHDVYFGRDAEAVAAATPTDTGIYQGRLPREQTTWTVGPLERNQTCYWRIDEINPDEPASPWRGRVCSFTPADFLIVDDFESYTSEPGQEVFQTWIDGASRSDLPGNGTGATVGADRTVVHSGRQAMQLRYNNTLPPHYSQTQRVWAAPQDWTAGGAGALSLWFRGYPMAFRETSPGHFLMSSTSGDIGGGRDHFRFVWQQFSGDGAISARIDSIREAAEWARAGVMIRENLGPGSAYACMSATPDGRRAFQSRTQTGAGVTSSTHSDSGAIGFPFWVKLERRGSSFTACYSQDGLTWVAQPGYENTGSAASPNPQTIGMVTRSSVFIGLALTSADPQRTTVGAFSDVAVTGNVSGPWRVADIGGANPSNNPGSLYVTFQDASGRRGTLVHPQPDAPLMMDWTEWRIPLADLLALGVDTAAVESIALGIDNRDRPAEAGSGLVHLDDITVPRL
jgi:hypothetical protein